jgi:4-amino-4-deoxy-L-arabinose transferase-like glycosyltransferase
VLAAQAVQAVLGGATCALTCSLGTAAGNRRIGLGAGLIMVFCGPVIFFEGQLLAAGWAAFWTAALAWGLLRCLERPSVRALFTLGLAMALAVYTRPTFLPFGLAVLVFLLVPGTTANPDLRRRAAHAGLVIAGLVAVVGPASMFFRTTTGHLGLVPPSGGINLYIGNNAEYERTINIRPGQAWANLVAEPARHGYEADPWAGDRYFRSQVLQFARTRPVRFLAGLGAKTLTLVSSREMPRNLDIYLHRQWSPLLSVLAWKLGAWGFPFGLIFLFAVVGVVRSGGRRLLVVKVLLAVLAANGFAITLAPWPRCADDTGGKR